MLKLTMSHQSSVDVSSRRAITRFLFIGDGFIVAPGPRRIGTKPFLTWEQKEVLHDIDRQV